MEERGFFCFMAPVYLLAPNMLLTFLIIFTPSISPSKTAMPVLKALINALPFSAYSKSVYLAEIIRRCKEKNA